VHVPLLQPLYGMPSFGLQTSGFVGFPSPSTVGAHVPL